MRLEASVHIHRSPQDVWAYLGDVSNVAAWDRGVSHSVASSSSPPGVGFEFDTYAHPRANSRDGSWGKMSYRIADIDSIRGCTIQLISTAGNARYFKHAQWHFRAEAEQDGCRVYCTAAFTLRWRYLLLAPVFLAMKKAIRTDLEQLKNKLEAPQA